MDEDCGRIRDQARSESIRITLHASERMTEHGITIDEVKHTLLHAQIVETYPEHRRGACCLISGDTAEGRPLHVVCTTAQPLLIVVTVYEPSAPQWTTPTTRGGN